MEILEEIEKSKAKPFYINEEGTAANPTQTEEFPIPSKPLIVRMNIEIVECRTSVYLNQGSTKIVVRDKQTDKEYIITASYIQDFIVKLNERLNSKEKGFILTCKLTQGERLEVL